MRRIFIFLIVPLLLSLGGGCSKADSGNGGGRPEPEVREPASLVLTADLSALVASTGTRASKADVNLIDHISLFLIDYNENRLVAYRNIFDRNNPAYPQIANDADGSNGFVNDAGQVDPTLSQSRVVRVTFDYNAPQARRCRETRAGQLRPACRGQLFRVGYLRLTRGLRHGSSRWLRLSIRTPASKTSIRAVRIFTISICAFPRSKELPSRICVRAMC